MKIVSYNLNGIRSAMSKGLLDWMQANPQDVFCFQETKAQPDQIEHGIFEELGYHSVWHSAEKKGYSGVATYYKVVPDHVVVGCGIDKYDREGRILRTDWGDITVLNCYFPSGTTGEIRQSVKMEFLADFFAWAHELRQERPNLIVAGDWNIANHPIDIHDPKGNKNSSGFLPDERAWMDKWFENGFTDSFRHLHPEKVEYSWWSFRAGARKNNKGWRIDYASVSNSLKDRIVSAGHDNDAMHSDHCPVFLEVS
jgi:exodeoxyribonuclease-3